MFVLDGEHRLVYRGAPDGDHQDESRGASGCAAALDAALAADRAGRDGDPRARVLRQVARLRISSASPSATSHTFTFMAAIRRPSRRQCATNS